MKTLIRDSGVRITYPDSFRIAEEEGARRGRRRLPREPISMPRTTADDSTQTEALLIALDQQDLKLVDTVSIDPVLESTPESGHRKRSAPPIPSRQKINLDVTLGTNEDAVILLEQDGVLSWSFPKKVNDEALIERRAKRTADGQRSQRRATFELEIHASSNKTRRARLPSFITEMIYTNVRAYVLRFTARVAASGAMAFLERNVREGLIHLKTTDPQSWGLVRPDRLKLPTDRQASILLMVHGTFSTTLGSFGALGATPWGINLLSDAQAKYDLVLGFDHLTLSRDPLENAVEILKALESIPDNGQVAPKIDIVCFSRGGLVARSLIEYLLPASNWKPQIGSVAFVGCTNEGTRLAEPDNWHQLIDLYTNLSMAAFKVIEMLPSAGAVLAGNVLRHGVETLGAFVKYLTTHAVTENAIPGLAAMEPDGPFVIEINKPQPDQPIAEHAQYFAIQSDFNPKLALDRDGMRGLPKKLLLMLADGFVDDLMNGSNDLVVNVDSMIAIDRSSGAFVKDAVEFKDTPEIYHTVYFTRPEVASALRTWLQLPPDTTAKSLDKRRMSTNRARQGDIVSPTLSATTETDILVVPSHGKLSDVLIRAEAEKPDFVVLRKPYRGDILNYAIKEEELRDLTKGFSSGVDIREFLDEDALFESDSSNTRTLAGRLEYRARDATMRRPEIAARTVIVDDGRVVGVVPAREDLPTLDELVVMAGAHPEDKQKAKRTQPKRLGRKGKRQAGVKKQRTDDKTPREAPVQSAWCHFAAWMDDEVALGATTTIEVEISREAIEHAAAVKGKGEFTDGKVVLELRPRRNFKTRGEDRTQIELPKPGTPEFLYFEAQPTNLGDGELWVIARQGLRPIVTLKLETRIVQKLPASRDVSRAAADVSSPPSTQFNPWMTLRILEQQQNDRASFRFDIEAKSIDVLDWGESRPLKADLRDYVDKLYNEIEEGWISSAGDTEAFTNALRAIGSSMFRELLPKNMQRLLWKNRKKIKNIVVHSTEPYIPWELLHLRNPDKRGMPKELLFLGQMGLVRWLYGIGLPPATTKIREGRAFYVVPRYPHPDIALPAAQAEKPVLESKFAAKSWPNDANGLLRKLEQPDSCDLFHFAGHGLAEGQDIDRATIMMRGNVRANEYLPDYLAATTINEFANMAEEDPNRPLVVLNACQVGRQGYRLTDIGGFASAFLRAGAGTFVSALWSVGDYAAKAFTEEFYEQLRDNGKTLTEAALLAREAARKADDTSWIAYTIYGNPDGVLSWEPKSQ